ncbi:hypothetical protein OIU78_003030, partial [Salix suchowensis]
MPPRILYLPHFYLPFLFLDGVSLSQVVVSSTADTI